MGFRFSKNVGKYLENIVYLDLRRRNSGSCQIYYYRNKNGSEVDFCLREGRKVILLLQVSENINSDNTRKREIQALASAMEELHLSEGWIVTLDRTETITVDSKTIYCCAIVEWLLRE